MTDPHYIGRILYVGLAIFATLLTAGLLMQERRYSVKKTALLWSLEGLALLVNLYVCFGLLPVPLRVPVSLTVGFFSYAGVFIAVSADGFWKKIYLLITFFCVCCIAWSGGLYLCYFLLPDSAPAIQYLVRTALHIALSLPFLLICRKYGRPLLREVSGFQKRSWRILSAVSAIYLFLFAALMSWIRLDNGVVPETLLIFCVAVCTFAAVSVLSISNIAYMRREAREALVKQKVEYLTSYVEAAGRAEQESRRIRHDKRHHDACIAAMARTGDTQGILRYLEQAQESVESFPAWCPHPMVNELLRSYAARAQAAGVIFSAQADTPAQSAVADVDFVAILANLLENALNACTAAGSGGPIRVRIRNVGAKTVIAASNPCDAGLKLENGLPAARSTGIDSIVSSAARYQGEVQYKVDGGICTAAVILNP